MRFAVDTGGTFTDLIVEHDETLSTFKSPTTPHDPLEGVIASLELAAASLELSLEELLGRGDMFIHGTTHGLNAILTGATARTAFLTTAGHPDVLLFREGGRLGPFDWRRDYGEPYVPRALTYEVRERIDSEGNVVLPLDEESARAACAAIERAGVEAVGVCFLWSVVNPDHERRMGALLEECLPGVPYTLSHALNPIIREYRRASSACIDASLKPILGRYLRQLRERLEESGFRGRVLIVSSSGGVMDASLVAEAPIHSLGSGPAMAPIAGRHYASADANAGTAIVADTGGTSYDVSLVRRGRIPWTRETWIGQQFEGHITGFASVDVKSIGAGGGSIAWLDEGNLLRVGPGSAGAQPGPACYGRGGHRPTVTDACLALGYLDPGYFLGGAMPLDTDAALDAIDRDIGEPLGLQTHDAAAAIVEIATEHMVHAIEDITVNQGLDPSEAVLIGGGAAAGLNAVAIARRLGCRRVIIPQTGAVLSAAGALMSDLTSEHSAAFFTTSTTFDFSGLKDVLHELALRCAEFAAGPGMGATDRTTEFTVEARYLHQMWQIEIPLDPDDISTPAAVERLQRAFDESHEDLFAVSDPGCPIEIVGVNARVRCRLRSEPAGARLRNGSAPTVTQNGRRDAFFRSTGLYSTPVRSISSVTPEETLTGPVLLESALTTVVVDPGATVTRGTAGSLVIEP
jgi:N-methylhydantoinase A